MNTNQAALNGYFRGQAEAIVFLTEAQYVSKVTSFNSLSEAVTSSFKLLDYSTEDINYWGKEFLGTNWIQVND